MILDPEDEAFNEIERKAKQRKEAVKATVNMKEEITKLLMESYDQGVKDALESPLYTHPPQRTWVGLTDEEVESYWDWEDFQTGAGRLTIFEMVRDIEAKLKENNNA